MNGVFLDYSLRRDYFYFAAADACTYIPHGGGAFRAVGSVFRQLVVNTDNREVSQILFPFAYPLFALYCDFFGFRRRGCNYCFTRKG